MTYLNNCREKLLEVLDYSIHITIRCFRSPFISFQFIIGFKSVISIIWWNVSKYQFTFPNIHFALNCNNPVRFLSENSQCSTQRSDIIIIIIISLSGMTWRNRTNWDRLNPEELWQRLQDASVVSRRCDGCCQTRLLQLMPNWMFRNVNWYFLLTDYSKI